MSGWWSGTRNRLALVRAARDQGDLPLFLRGCCVAFVAPLLVRLSLPRLETLLEPRVAPAPCTPERAAHMAEVALAALRFGRPLVRRGCLVRGITLYHCLRRAGVDVQLCFGLGAVERGDGFDGHCWLVMGGEPYLEARDPRPRYTVMYTFPGREHNNRVAEQILC